MLEYTSEELFLEYLEDLIEAYPAEAHPREIAEAGTFVHKTGDPVFDEWERKVAAGEETDLLEMFSVEDQAKLKRVLGTRTRQPDGFHDVYGGAK